MVSLPAIRLAKFSDAEAIARMSRDHIEYGLDWGWSPTRVIRNMRDRSTNIAVMQQGGILLGFGIMRYADVRAHLLLLAVHPQRRRRGLATALLNWLEAVARTAAIQTIRVEARAENAGALAFYQSRGYAQTDRIAGYYRGVEDGVRLEKALWPVAAGSP
jgi:ribosomal-protein-alanine N-acetyltransferase